MAPRPGAPDAVKASQAENSRSSWQGSRQGLSTSSTDTPLVYLHSGSFDLKSAASSVFTALITRRRYSDKPYWSPPVWVENTDGLVVQSCLAWASAVRDRSCAPAGCPDSRAYKGAARRTAQSAQDITLARFDGPERSRRILDGQNTV